MSYVPIKGGKEAIREAERLLSVLRCSDPKDSPLSSSTIENQLGALHSKVLSEGSLYDEALVSLAIKQSRGDSLEAAYYLRAYRSTRPRLGETPVLDTGNMRLIRRISSAFKNIPGGQMLGPTTDYIQRLFQYDLLDESPETFRNVVSTWLHDTDKLDTAEIPDTFPKVVDLLREQGLLPPRLEKEITPFDITRQPLIHPLPRAAQLSIMARAETGGLLALAYSNMRGYGDVHPTIAELRVGYLPILAPHPVSGEHIEIGEILMTECEVVASHQIDPDSGKVYLSSGYGACFGHNETKAIAMAILDRSLDNGRRHGVTHPSEDPEFLLNHIDSIDSMGFTIHYKMPHYVTFESDLDRARATQKQMNETRTDA